MRFRWIDAANISDHTFLREDDRCYFLHEYTSNKDYNFGVANNLISNLKKPIERRGRPEYQYKLRAIADCARLLGQAINSEWLKVGTLVPIPPSKASNDPAFDDRILQICKRIPSATSIDVREIVRQRVNIRAAHESAGNRPTVQELLDIYFIDEAQAEPRPRAIAVVDDVLTAGTHYRAVHTILTRRFPGVPVVGMFVARRVFPTEDHDDWFPSA